MSCGKVAPLRLSSRYYKAPNTVVGPRDPIVIPRSSTRTDWEVELGVVIGARASFLTSVEASFEVIAGYVLSNDVSEQRSVCIDARPSPV